VVVVEGGGELVVEVAGVAVEVEVLSGAVVVVVAVSGEQATAAMVRARAIRERGLCGMDPRIRPPVVT
jgi:hypothetical protein